MEACGKQARTQNRHLQRWFQALFQVLCSSRFVLINRSERNRMHGVWGISPHSSRCEILMVPLDSM
jgi:hypothetical protein